VHSHKCFAKRIASAIATFLACLLAVAGCTSEPSSGGTVSSAKATSRLKVVCTTGQVGDLVANVGGEHVQVETLMGPGVDPHLYRATPGSTKKLTSADVVFYNGLHLEGRLADVLENLARRKPVFAITDELAKDHAERLRKPPQFEGHFDPHVWFDPSLWIECTKTAASRLAEVDPSHADDYRRNADRFIAELAKLDRECREALSQIPKSQRVLVTAHDAFGYFGLAYDVEVHGLQGISTADEADLAAVSSLIDLLVKRKIKAVFVESSVPAKNVQSLIEGCAARGHKVVQGGELFSDAMGEPGTPEGTYLGMVRANLRTIVSALK
jgi:manganese/zinc/iron transport system substrate-binding protein